MNELDNLVYRVQLLEKAVAELQDYLDDEFSEVDHCIQFLEEAVAELQFSNEEEVAAINAKYEISNGDFAVFLCDELGLDWELEPDSRVKLLEALG